MGANTNSRIKDIALIVIFASLFYLPTWYITREKFFRLNTDYDDKLGTYYYLVDFFKKNQKLPFINPYISTGIQVIADPTSVTLNPVLTPLMIFFGVETGIRLSILVFYVSSGVSMYVFLAHLPLSRWLRMWGSLLYMTAGSLSAFIASGHIPQFLTFPFIPLFLLLLIKSQPPYRYSIFGALLLAYILFSGYIFLLWFLSIFYGISRIYYVVTKQASIVRSLLSTGLLCLLFVCFSWPKLIPYLTDVAPNMERFFPIDPFAGSIHFFLYPLGFIVPLQVNFYERPFFQRLFGFYYNWHEYFAFISPFPLVFLLKVKLIWKNQTVRVLTLFLFTAICYVSLKFSYSPFYWIFKYVAFARTFRVPQRIYEPSTSVLIVLCVLCASKWLDTSRTNMKRIGVALCVLSLVSTSMATIYTLTNAFETRRVREEVIVRELRAKDASKYYVVVFSCCLQTFLMKERISVLNYYQGWRPKNSPNFLNKEGNAFNYDKLEEVKPRYVIADKNKDLTKYSYAPYIENEILRVWRTQAETVMPEI